MNSYDELLEAGAHVTFLDRNVSGTVHEAQSVLINGREVLVPVGGIDIEYRDEVATSGTLKIPPQASTFE